MATPALSNKGTCVLDGAFCHCNLSAGFSASTELIEIIQRQAPGTWLPLKILRGDSELELLARFPQSFE